MAQVSMKEMLDAGVHFGHQTERWNPKMKSFVFTSRGGIHIIDLQQTVDRAKAAADFIRKMASNGGRMIFVGTKKQSMTPIIDAAQRCGQFYVTKRWLGGTLTNFATIKTSIDRLRKIDQMREKGELELFSKKERGQIEKEYIKLNDYLVGIRDMKEPPQALFVVDLNKEHIAVAEAKKLGIPVVGIADSNVDPGSIDYPIPGNDDAIRSIALFANMAAEAYLEGSKDWELKARQMAEERKVTEEVAVPVQKAQPTKTRTDGPAIVKVGEGGRKLVAAGLAEEVEILEELEKTPETDDSDVE